MTTSKGKWTPEEIAQLGRIMGEHSIAAIVMPGLKLIRDGKEQYYKNLEAEAAKLTSRKVSDEELLFNPMAGLEKD